MNRRGFFLGLGASLVAAPAIVRAASLMPVRGIVMPITDAPWVDFPSAPAWSFAQFGDVVVAVNPEHAPLILNQGRWSRLRPSLTTIVAGDSYYITAVNPEPRPIATV